MPKLLVDISSLDLTQPVIEEEELRYLLPHREEFQLVDAIVHLDLEAGMAVGVKQITLEDWWTRAHIPGRPIFPGVLLAEGCAQVSTVLIKKQGIVPPERFIGLGGLDEARFRGAVVPPALIYFVATKGQVSSRLARYPSQAFVQGKLVMETTVLGVML